MFDQENTKRNRPKKKKKKIPKGQKEKIKLLTIS